jgi:hypothetical protein
MCPHLAVHCGGNNYGCGGGETGGGHRVAREPTGHCAEPLCCCWCNEDCVGTIGGNDVADATVWEKVKEICINGVAGECAQGER